MKFLDFDRDEIIINSTITKDGYFEYCLGNRVEITTIKSTHSNSLISENLSSNVKDDKLMIRYTPTNTVLFSQSILSSDIDELYASCYIDKKNNKIYIGTPMEFGVTSGVLVFSGYLSANSLIEKDRCILCNKRFEKSIRDRVRVLSIGVRGDKLYGLWYIPSTKGVAVGIKDRRGFGISPTTLKEKEYVGYHAYNIREWFDNAKVREI